MIAFVGKYSLFIMGALLCLLVMLITVRKRAIAKQETIFRSKKRKSSGSGFCLKVYNFLSRFPIFRKRLDTVQRVVESNTPGDAMEVRSNVAKIVIGSYVASIAVFVIVMLWQSSFYSLMCAFITIYVLNREIIGQVADKGEQTLLRELDSFMELVQFHYLQSHMVDEAIRDAITGKLKVIERHAVKLLAILDAEDLETELTKYTSSIRNPYMKELACICVTTHTYSDSVMNGESTFLKKLRDLKQRISKDIEMRTEIKHSFKGMTYIPIIAMYAGAYLKEWVPATITNVEFMMRGSYGTIVYAITPFLCLVTYLSIDRMKMQNRPDMNEHAMLVRISRFPPIRGFLDRYYNQNYGKRLQITKLLKQTGSTFNVYTLTIKRVLTAVVFGIVVLVFVNFMHYSESRRVFDTIVSEDVASLSASEEEKIIMMTLVRHYTNVYLEQDALKLCSEATGQLVSEFNTEVRAYVESQIRADLTVDRIISEDEIMATILQYNAEHANGTTLYTAYLGSTDGNIREYNESMHEIGMGQLEEFRQEAMKADVLDAEVWVATVVSDVLTALEEYYNAYFHWTEFLLACIASILGYEVPLLWIQMNKRGLQHGMEQEVIQFQSLILILRTTKQMSVDVILDWILKFAVIFRSSIHKCIVNYPTDDYAAFEALVADEPFEPLQSLARQLEMCDNVGVFQAFSNLEVSQRNYIAQSEQHTRHAIQDNSSLATLLAIGIVLFILLAFMTIPLVLVSFNEITSVMSQMSS